MTILAYIYLGLVLIVMIGMPVWHAAGEPNLWQVVVRWRAARRSRRASEELRLEVWAAKLREMNLADRVGVLYAGRHCKGTPVTEFVVLTYSAGPRHRLVTT